MVHSVLVEFPILVEEKFLLQEAALMFKRDACQLKAAASEALKTVEKLSNLTQYEVITVIRYRSRHAIYRFLLFQPLHVQTS